MQPDISVAELLTSPPLLHVDGSGQTTSYKLSDAVLELLAQTVKPGDATLETGEGVSTVLCALLGANHVCVTPNQETVDRIRAFCEEHRIALDRVRFAVGFSEEVLPGLELPPLDLFLIDGSHSMPATFIDWYYGSRTLRRGGRVVVDDVDLWPCALLADFLASEPMWGEEPHPDRRARVFTRLSEGAMIAHWQNQPMVMRENERLAYPGTRRLALKAGRAGGLLLRGDIGTFRTKLAKNLRRRP